MRDFPSEIERSFFGGQRLVHKKRLGRKFDDKGDHKFEKGNTTHHHVRASRTIETSRDDLNRGTTYSGFYKGSVHKRISMRDASLKITQPNDS